MIDRISQAQRTWREGTLMGEQWSSDSHFKHTFLYNTAALTGIFILSLDSYLPRAEIMGDYPLTQPHGPALYLHSIHAKEM